MQPKEIQFLDNGNNRIDLRGNVNFFTFPGDNEDFNLNRLYYPDSDFGGFEYDNYNGPFNWLTCVITVGNVSRIKKIRIEWESQDTQPALQILDTNNNVIGYSGIDDEAHSVIDVDL
jgi:hypothetical protein